MKTISGILISIFFLWTNFLVAHPTVNTQEALKTELSKIFASKNFSIESVKTDVAKKRIYGVGTFFQQKEVKFEAQYEGSEAILSFRATMPNKAKVKVSNKKLKSLAGQDLKKLVPAALKKAIYLEQFGFTIAKGTKQIEALQFQFSTLQNWELFTSTKLTLGQIKISFNVVHPTQKEKRKLTGQLTGQTKIGNVALDITGVLQAQKENFELIGTTQAVQLKESLQALCGRTEIQGIKIPAAIFDLQLNTVQVNLLPYQKTINLNANSNWGLVNVFVKQKNKTKKDNSKTDYIITINTPKDFRLSKLNSKLKGLDRIPVGNQKIVISSAKKSKKESAKIPSLSQLATKLKKGCNYITALDLTKLKLDHLLGIKKLIVVSALSDQLTNIVLEGELGADLPLGPTTKLSGAIFRLKPSPKDFAISLLGTMDAQLDQDLLNFKGGVELGLTDQSLNFLAIMQGNWNNPLGAKGLVMSDVGLQVGASFTTAPVLLPNVGLKGDIKVGNFTGAGALAFDTRNPSKSMMAVSFNKLILMDLLDLVVDPKITKKLSKGMKKTLREFYLQDVKMEVVPQDIEVLGKNYAAGFRTEGGISLAGLTGAAKIDINYKNGMLLAGEVEPIDLKVFELRGANGKKKPQLHLDLRKGKTPKVLVNGLVNMLGLEAQTDVELLDNGFRFMIGGKIFNVFDGVIEAKGSDLKKAGGMGLKVKMKNDLLNFVDQGITNFVSDKTKSAIKDLTKAQAAIKDAEKSVANWEKKINEKRKVVRKEQAQKRKKYEAAKKKVNQAQKKVNGLNKEIKQLKKKIKAKNKAWQAPEKAVLVSRLGTVYASHKLAWAALEGAKKVLDGFKGLNTNPDLDIRVSSLIVKKGTAMGTLKGARGVLEGLKFTLGVTGKAGLFIVNQGKEMLVNIRKAKFEGGLQGLSGGQVKLDTELEWLGKKHKIKFDFNFNNPAKAVKAMAKELLKLK